VVSTCFDGGRQYGSKPNVSPGVAPWFAKVLSVDGGACNDPTLACYTLARSSHYGLPPTLVSAQQAAPGTWQGIQSYTLVTGTGSIGSTAWDCTSPDPAKHWSTKGEVYCWTDYQTVIGAIPASVTVTDPASVAAAWGRTVPGPLAAAVLAPAQATIVAGSTQSYTAEGFDAVGNDLGDVTAQTSFSIDGAGSCQANACGATGPGSYTIT